MDIRDLARQGHSTRAIARLTGQGLTYECFCTRREIREAASAPHPDDPAVAADGSYPGTCRDLSPAQIAERRSTGRPSLLSTSTTTSVAVRR